MAGAMLLDIRRQPACLGALVERVNELRQAGAAHVAPAVGSRVLTLASGDGWFAARAATAAARSGALSYRPCSSLEFLCYEAAATTPDDRVVAISMSGNVDRVVAGVTAARARGVRTYLITNGDGGRAGQVATAKISLGIVDLAPFLCGTSSYTATLLALWLLLDGATGREMGTSADGGLDALAHLPGVLPDFIEAADAFASTLMGQISDRPITGVRFLAAGPNVATGDYGAAKMVELTRVPAWSDDIEEFAHRQYWSMPADDLVVYLAAHPEVATYADRSAAALAELGVRTVAFETPAAPVPAATYRLALPSVEEVWSPLLLAIPLQLLGYRLAQATGLDPDTRLHLKSDEARFLVSRKLTRRSLIGTGQ